MVFDKSGVKQAGMRIKLLSLTFVSLFALNCFSSEKSLPDTVGQGQISGKVVGSDGTAIVGVTFDT